MNLRTPFVAFLLLAASCLAQSSTCYPRVALTRIDPWATPEAPAEDGYDFKLKVTATPGTWVGIVGRASIRLVGEKPAGLSPTAWNNAIAALNSLHAAYPMLGTCASSSMSLGSGYSGTCYVPYAMMESALLAALASGDQERFKCQPARLQGPMPSPQELPSCAFDFVASQLWKTNESFWGNEAYQESEVVGTPQWVWDQACAMDSDGDDTTNYEYEIFNPGNLWEALLTAQSGSNYQAVSDAVNALPLSTNAYIGVIHLQPFAICSAPGMLPSQTGTSTGPVNDPVSNAIYTGLGELEEQTIDLGQRLTLSIQYRGARFNDREVSPFAVVTPNGRLNFHLFSNDVRRYAQTLVASTSIGTLNLSGRVVGPGHMVFTSLVAPPANTSLYVVDITSFHGSVLGLDQCTWRTLTIQ